MIFRYNIRTPHNITITLLKARAYRVFVARSLIGQLPVTSLPLSFTSTVRLQDKFSRGFNCTSALAFLRFFILFLLSGFFIVSQRRRISTHIPAFSLAHTVVPQTLVVGLGCHILVCCGIAHSILQGRLSRSI